MANKRPGAVRCVAQNLEYFKFSPITRSYFFKGDKNFRYSIICFGFIIQLLGLECLVNGLGLYFKDHLVLSHSLCEFLKGPMVMRGSKALSIYLLFLLHLVLVGIGISSSNQIWTTTLSTFKFTFFFSVRTKVGLNLQIAQLDFP